MTDPTIPQGFEQHLDLHFRSIAEHVPHIFSFIDPETYAIKYINRVEEGYNLKEVIGKEIFKYLCSVRSVISRTFDVHFRFDLRWT